MANIAKMGRLRDKFRRLAAVGLIGGALGGATLSGLEQAVLSNKAYAQANDDRVSGTPLVQEYDLHTGNLQLTDISQRLARNYEYLREITVLSRGAGKPDALLGTVITKDGRKIFYNETGDVNQRVEYGPVIRDYIKRFTGQDVEIAKAVNLSIPGAGNFLVVYTLDYRVFCMNPENLSEPCKIGDQPITEATQGLKGMLGFVPTYMMMDPSGTLYVRDSTTRQWFYLLGPAYSRLEPIDIEGLFHDFGLARVTSIGTIKSGDGLTKLAAVRFPLSMDLGDRALANDMRLSNQVAIGGSSYRSTDTTTTWPDPVVIYRHPSIDRRLVSEALDIFSKKSSISYLIVDIGSNDLDDKGNIPDGLYGILFRAGTDGLGCRPDGTGCVAAGRGGIVKTGADNSAEKGLVVVLPNKATYSPDNIPTARVEASHALGHIDYLPVNGNTFDQYWERIHNLIKGLTHKIPRGVELKTDSGGYATGIGDVVRNMQN